MGQRDLRFAGRVHAFFDGAERFGFFLETARQPDQFQIAAALSLEETPRLHLVEVAV